MQITIAAPPKKSTRNILKNPATHNSQNTSAADLIETVKQSYEDWRNTLLRTSNEGLYNILAKCLRVYEMMTEDSEVGAKLRLQFSELVKAKKLKFNGDTHTVAKIARIVFDADRKKGSAYGMVLRAAISRGVGHADLVNFIQQEGGIENIRLASPGRNVETTEEKADRAWASVKDLSLAVVKDKKLATVSDQAKIGSRTVLLATQQANGEFVVHAILEKESAVNAAFAAFAGQAAKNDSNKASEAQVANSVTDRAALRAKAAQALLAA